MEAFRHAFSKSRSSSSASSPPPLRVRSSRDSTSAPVPGTATPPDRSLKPGGKSPSAAATRDSMASSSSSKRDSGIGRSILGSLGGRGSSTTNGRNHSRAPSGASAKSLVLSVASNPSLNVSDRLEAVLAQTADVDAANVAHLAQAVSEMRGKAHGLHGAHTGLLASDVATPASSSSNPHTPPQHDFVPFSPATLSRTRKVKASYEIRMTGIRIAQQAGKSWNPLQVLRDREVRRLSGEPQLDLRVIEKTRTRDSSKAGSLSSFAGSESIGKGRTKGGNKQHNSPIQPSSRGSLRQQGSRHHADRFRTTQRGYEFWNVTPEEFLADISWQQANPNRMINAKGELIHPLPAEEEWKSDSLGSKNSSLDLDGKGIRRYSSDGGPVTPQMSFGSPLIKTPSMKSPFRNVPSFTMPTTSVPRSRSPSPTRGSVGKHSRQTSDLLDVPTRVKRKIRDKIMGTGSAVSSRSHSPAQSDYFPPVPVIDLSKAPRSNLFPMPLRLDIGVLGRRATIMTPRKSIAPLQAETVKRDLARTRARLASTGITARAMLAKDNQITPFTKCYALMGTLAGLHRSINTSFEQQHPKLIAELNATLSTMESRQAQIGDQVQSALAKTRNQISSEIANIAAEQTSTLLLQVKAVEDKMDALEYRTRSGWTHEKTLHVVFLVLEYIVMVVLWHLWLLLSVLRFAKKITQGLWIVVWWIVMRIYHFILWLFFMNPS